MNLLKWGLWFFVTPVAVYVYTHCPRRTAISAGLWLSGFVTIGLGFVASLVHGYVLLKRIRRGMSFRDVLNTENW